jgi:biotin operon repressor
MKGPFVSGRKLARELEAFSDEIYNGFEHVTHLLKKGSEEVKVHIEDLIAKNDKQSPDD